MVEALRAELAVELALEIPGGGRRLVALLERVMRLARFEAHAGATAYALGGQIASAILKRARERVVYRL